MVQRKEANIYISIHAPREGGDKTAAVAAQKKSISIHAPREGGDLTYRFTASVSPVRFQSTPPARGATGHLKSLSTVRNISIHAPREGGDNLICICSSIVDKFQSTPPARGATVLHTLRPHEPQRDFNPRPPRGGRQTEG